MKYSPRQYATAFASIAKSASATEKKTYAHNFLTIIKKAGDWHKLDSIMAEIPKAETKLAGGKNITVMVANEQAVSLVEQIRQTRKPIDSIAVKIDPRLVAGVKVIIDDDQVLDYSLASRLQTMFNTTTS